MMAAYDLRKEGYQVTMFEALNTLGGMMAVGIPEFRLPKAVLKAEADILNKLGVEIKFNTRIGKDIQLADIQKSYDAVFLAVGAHKGRKLGVAGDTADGVIDGTEFLFKVNTGEKVAAGSRVVVVGGGNVAIDCARTCVRLGFKDVSIVYRRSRAEMPAIPMEIHEAEEEGVKLVLLSGPSKVVTSGSKATGLGCVKMQLGEPDASGRRRPEPIAGSDYVIDADLIIAAVGEEPELSFLDAAAVNSGRISADPITLATPVKGLFAGGDAVTGAATVVQAMAAGRKAARSIDLFFKGEPMEQGRDGEAIFETKLIVDTFDIAQAQRARMPALPVNDRKTNFKEVETGFTKEAAIEEANRCLQCDCKICVNLLGCPALITEDGKAAIDESGCPGCGVCAQVCPHDAIKAGN